MVLEIGNDRYAPQTKYWVNVAKWSIEITLLSIQEMFLKNSLQLIPNCKKWLQCSTYFGHVLFRKAFSLGPPTTSHVPHILAAVTDKKWTPEQVSLCWQQQEDRLSLLEEMRRNQWRRGQGWECEERPIRTERIHWGAENIHIKRKEKKLRGGSCLTLRYRGRKTSDLILVQELFHNQSRHTIPPTSKPRISVSHNTIWQDNSSTDQRDRRKLRIKPLGQAQASQQQQEDATR